MFRIKNPIRIVALFSALIIAGPAGRAEAVPVNAELSQTISVDPSCRYNLVHVTSRRGESTIETILHSTTVSLIKEPGVLNGAIQFTTDSGPVYQYIFDKVAGSLTDQDVRVLGAADSYKIIGTLIFDRNIGNVSFDYIITAKRGAESAYAIYQLSGEELAELDLIPICHNETMAAIKANEANIRSNDSFISSLSGLVRRYIRRR